jgi:hypothetical protein
VHVLVAAAFLGPRPGDGYSVNHLNGDKADNCVENLEWATARRQQMHALEHGLKDHASVHALTDEQALEVFNDRETSGREFARRFGVSTMTISAIRRGRSYRWVTGMVKPPELLVWQACTDECECRCHYRRR